MAFSSRNRRSVLRKRGVIEAIVTLVCFLTTLMYLQSKVQRNDDYLESMVQLTNQDPSIDLEDVELVEDGVCPSVSPLLGIKNDF